MAIGAVNQGIQMSSYPDKGRSFGTTLTDGFKMGATGALAGLTVAVGVGVTLAFRHNLGGNASWSWPTLLGVAGGAGGGIGALLGVSGLKMPFQA